MRLRDYIIRRILLLIPVLLGISLFLFILTNVVLDPVSVYLRSPQNYRFINQIRQLHGLDQPLYIRYFTWIMNILTGKWGTAVSDQNRPVLSSIVAWFPGTIELTITSMFIIIGIGIPAGILSATRKDKPADQVTRITALSGISLPTFLLGLLLQFILSYQFQRWGLPYLPSTGRNTYYILLLHPLTKITGLNTLDSLLTGNWPIFLDTLSHLILPAFTLAFVNFGILTRIVRSSMLEVLRQDYITLARSKGLSERVVIYKHAFRNAMIPTLTLIGLFFAALLGGAVITETIFIWPGIGRFAANAVLSNDVDAILGFTIVISLIYVFGNLIVDLLYAFVDPRIRLG